MSWGNPFALYLLALIPVFVLFIYFYKKQRRRQLLKFCDETLLDFHNKSFSSFYFNLKTFILTISFAFLVIAIARPQWDRDIRIVEIFGQDLVFLIDVSKSMDAQDINPTRLERAKRHINLFLDELKGDRVAIVAFAGSAVTICPLTTDYAALKLIVSNLTTDTVTDYGTDIGVGLKRAGEAFNQESSAKTIILLSDGEDLEEEGTEIAKQLARQGVVIYALGIGTPEGSPIMIKNDKGQDEYAKNDQGNVIITRVDVLGLHKIAETTGGNFYMISPSYAEIFDILKLIKNNEQTKSATRQYFRYKEQYHYFLYLALILLLADSVVIFRNNKVGERCPSDS
ncbi:MAG: VWA domain-containing protein [Candidatus Cloacimonetes bacterium]|nr:VWA domain-containing protein [Candidatus Cloacimonadota bacterium]